MANNSEEEVLLRKVTLENARTVLSERRRVEQELLSTKNALQQKADELANSLAMTRAILEATTDAILATDPSYKVTGYNEKYISMWGIPQSIEQTGDHLAFVAKCAERFRDSGPYLNRIHEICDSALDETFDVLELADGKVIQRFSRKQLIGGKIFGRVWTFRDVTQKIQAEAVRAAIAMDNARLYNDIKKAEQEKTLLLESERAARAEAERVSHMKDEFLATLSHELRTPLTAILGWSQILLAESYSPKELHQGLQTISRNAHAQTQLIEDLLDMSRIISGKVHLDVQKVNLASVIESAFDSVRPACEAKGIRLRKVLDPLSSAISGDPNRLQQIIWNLLSNAVKFTPKDGVVDVQLKRVDSHLEISISDTGTGISPEFLPYVFERFRQEDSSSTRKHGGLGLGLAIVKQLVELHGGSVWANSKGAGQGSSFTVSLPSASMPGVDSKEASPAASLDESKFIQVDLFGIKVLVVDDEKDARELIRRALMRCNADVITAENAVEGLRLLKVLRPDVLVSDIGMPDKDGYQFIAEVRELNAEDGGDIPAAALTAFARSEDRTKALIAGFQIHIAKPIELNELVATVASLALRTSVSSVS